MESYNSQLCVTPVSLLMHIIRENKHFISIIIIIIMLSILSLNEKTVLIVLFMIVWGHFAINTSELLLTS